METIILTIPEYARFLEGHHKKAKQCKDSAWNGWQALIYEDKRYILGATHEDIDFIERHPYGGA